VGEPVASLLRRSLDHLAAEVPGGYRLLCDALGGHTIGIDVDGERFGLRGGAGLEVVPDGPASVRIGTTRRGVLAVLDGELSLVAAVEADAVTVLGPLDEVVRAHDALVAYVHAAVRAPGAAGLLDALRDHR
jgi:hypothetical protein